MKIKINYEVGFNTVEIKELVKSLEGEIKELQLFLSEIEKTEKNNNYEKDYKETCLKMIQSDDFFAENYFLMRFREFISSEESDNFENFKDFMDKNLPDYYLNQIDRIIEKKYN